MGTNYYLRTNICEKCGRYDEIHIGKSSMGWPFIFEAHNLQFPDDGPRIGSWLDFLEYLKNGKIFNEYGEQISLNEFKEIVTDRKIHPDCEKKIHNLTNHYQDVKGYWFYDREFS